MKVLEQPIRGVVDASTWHTDRTWKEDIIHMSKPSEFNSLNHVILIVGYGKSEFENVCFCWIVKFFVMLVA
jgi:hypothetical protein